MHEKFASKIRQFQPRSETQPTDSAAIVRIQDREFAVLPLDEFRQKQANNTGWNILAVGMGATGTIAAASLLVSSLKALVPAPVPAPEPVVVQKEVPYIVPSSCIAFCGNGKQRQ